MSDNIRNEIAALSQEEALHWLIAAGWMELNEELRACRLTPLGEKRWNGDMGSLIAAGDEGLRQLCYRLAAEYQAMLS